MSKLKTPIIITENLDEHPAVIAWSLLRPDLPKPKTIEVIKPNKSKSFVLRLLGVGENDCSVIAKQTEESIAMIERSIYENALRYLSKATIRYYGHIKTGANSSWIFTEDIGGSPFSYNNIQHISLAIEWLVELHTAVPKLDCLSDRGLDSYHSHLISAYDTITLNLGNSALSNKDIALLKSIISHFDFLRQRWDRIYTLYEQMPKGFIHGDFKVENLCVRSSNNENALFVFDWEFAGWGLPGIDMWRLNIENYWLKVRTFWQDITFEEIKQIANLGKLLWCLSAIDWVTKSLAYEWIDKPMCRIKFYEEHLSAAIRDFQRN